MKRKIAHFFIDDKFFYAAKMQFESLEDYENRFFVISAHHQFKYLDRSSIEIINPNDLLKYIKDPSFCDILILHTLNSIPIHQISEICSNIKVVWLSWGFDIYNNIFPQYPLIKIRKQHIESVYPLRVRIRRLWNRMKRKKQELCAYYFGEGYGKRKEFENAIQRINYFSGVFPEEYDYLKKNKFFKARYFCFNYFGKSKPSELNKLSKLGTAIQVGHNGMEWLNHIDVFKRLIKMNLGDRKIICPLSYGNNSDYTNFVIKEGYRYFHNNFSVLSDFLPIDKYKALLDNVGYVVLNVKRQCGVGNILIGIRRGAKVFFPKDSINYRHFSEMGVKVFSIEEDLNEKELNTQLSDDEIRKNCELVDAYYNYEEVMKRLINSLNSIFQ